MGTGSALGGAAVSGQVAHPRRPVRNATLQVTPEFRATFGGLGVAAVACAPLTLGNKRKRASWAFGIASVLRQYYVGAGRMHADRRYEMLCRCDEVLIRADLPSTNAPT